MEKSLEPTDKISNSHTTSEIQNLLVPLLDEMGWNKNYRKLLDILKNNKQNVDIPELQYILSKFNLELTEKKYKY